MIIGDSFFLVISINITTMPKFVMSDGRAFTNFQPSCTLNKDLQAKYKIPDSHDYRYFLQKNADQVRSDFAAAAAQGECVMCPVCKQALKKN
jgi:hypothetical protein